MRSWVMGRFPSAAARWRGVRASRGETQEFTWTSMWQFYINIQHHKLTICHAVVNLDHTSSRDEWASARDTSAMSHLIQSLKVLDSGQTSCLNVTNVTIVTMFTKHLVASRRILLKAIPANGIDQSLRRWVWRWQGCQPFFPLVPGKGQMSFMNILHPLLAAFFQIRLSMLTWLWWTAPFPPLEYLAQVSLSQVVICKQTVFFCVLSHLWTWHWKDHVTSGVDILIPGLPEAIGNIVAHAGHHCHVPWRPLIQIQRSDPVSKLYKCFANCRGW